MEFSGTFEIDGVTAEEVWLALSDPVLIKQALPGCAFLTKIDDRESADFDALAASADGDDPPVLPDADPETVMDRAFVPGGTYAALMEIGVGSVNPSFRTYVTIESREFPEMVATAEGSAANSAFELRSGMSLSEADDIVTVDWWAESDVFGRVAQLGQRVMTPVANRVVNRFFSKVEEQLAGLEDEDETGLRDRIRGLL